MLNLISEVLKIFTGIFVNISGVETAKVTSEAEVATAAIQGEAAVQQKWWFVAAIPAVYAIAFVPWLYKAAMWDKVIGPALGFHSSTDPLAGALAVAFNVIIMGVFLHSGISLWNSTK